MSDTDLRGSSPSLQPISAPILRCIATLACGVSLALTLRFCLGLRTTDDLFATTLAVGRGYRTNDEGIRQLQALLGSDVEVVVVPLPHWQGPSDVFHLMSMISPLADDLALVYSPLLPVPFREDLLARGIELVEVPAEEFDSMGCNVLAVAPRVAVAMEGNPETRRRMEAAGVEAHLYSGAEISAKGCGGPTCLTRPLERTR